MTSTPGVLSVVIQKATQNYGAQGTTLRQLFFYVGKKSMAMSMWIWTLRSWKGSQGLRRIKEIKAYIEEKYGFKISTLFIAQIKDKVGLEKRKKYNPGSGKGKVPVCTPEKEEAIMDAFQHFSLI